MTINNKSPFNFSSSTDIRLPDGTDFVRTYSFACMLLFAAGCTPTFGTQVSQSSSQSSAKRVYFAGALFSVQELAGNDLLRDAIEKASNYRYDVVLPQRHETHSAEAKVIRDQDLNNLLSADAILANFNGADLDSGTVVEYMVAKSLDMPAVILRTDFRVFVCGETPRPFNPMLSSFPRTELLGIDSFALYDKYSNNHAAATADIAKQVVQALDRTFADKELLSNVEKENLKALLTTLYQIDVNTTR